MPLVPGYHLRPWWSPLTLVPGVELNAFYSMVPVTGVTLLLQELMRSGTPQAGHWAYFVATLVPMLIYSWLGAAAGRWNSSSAK